MNPYPSKLAYPSSPLISLIHHYEWLEIETGSSDTSLITHASYSSGFMFLFGSGKEKATQFYNQETTQLTNNNLINPSTCFGRLKTIEQTTVFRIIFQPGALYSIYGIPLHHLRNTITHIEYTLDTGISHVYECMSEQNQFLECIHLFEAYLLQKAITALNMNLFQQIKSVISRNTLTIHATSLAEYMATSKRNLNRKMSQELGISAKEFLQTHRFCEVLQYLDRHAQEQLSQVGLRFNYFDQAHFIRDFKKRLGCTPRQYQLVFHKLAAFSELESSSIGWKMLNSRMSHLYNFGNKRKHTLTLDSTCSSKIGKHTKIIGT